ncbi:MAG: OsmC family protein [Saprospiraceae bacterium]
MEHHYTLDLEWTGNLGNGTSEYTGYSRDHLIKGLDKLEIMCSSDPNFRGDKNKYNPEELFLASFSSCHMLWYLHLCADNGIVVKTYIDRPKGLMITPKDEPGRFKEIILNPKVTIQNDESKVSLALELHNEAHQKCFIANSCNFPVLHNPEILIANS